MRYIDPTNLYLKSNNWSGQELWKNLQLKKDFRDYFHNKCWYTECSLVGQDVHIDHFRPKAKIVKFENYPYNTTIAKQGYDWLANDYKNYRACCIYANRKTGDGGKSNFFPLQQGSSHAQNGNMNGEVAMLIDPLVQKDVQLLAFLGKDIACTSNNIYDKSRVRASAIIYNLVNGYIGQERLEKWNEVNRTVDRYKGKEITDKVLLQDLQRFVSREAKYSAVAICCVKSRKADIPEQIYLQLQLIL